MPKLGCLSASLFLCPVPTPPKACGQAGGSGLPSVTCRSQSWVAHHRSSMFTIINKGAITRRASDVLECEGWDFPCPPPSAYLQPLTSSSLLRSPILQLLTMDTTLGSWVQQRCLGVCPERLNRRHWAPFSSLQATSPLICSLLLPRMPLTS